MPLPLCHRGAHVSENFSIADPETQPRVVGRCSHCHTRLMLEDLQPGARLSASLAYALIDHLLHITTELAEVRWLVEGAVL